jgi:hypothetical protein
MFLHVGPPFSEPCDPVGGFAVLLGASKGVVDHPQLGEQIFLSLVKDRVPVRWTVHLNLKRQEKLTTYARIARPLNPSGLSFCLLSVQLSKMVCFSEDWTGSSSRGSIAYYFTVFRRRKDRRFSCNACETAHRRASKTSTLPDIAENTERFDDDQYFSRRFLRLGFADGVRR